MAEYKKLHKQVQAIDAQKGKGSRTKAQSRQKAVERLLQLADEAHTEHHLRILTSTT